MKTMSILIVSGTHEVEKNIDRKIKKARGALFKLLGPVFSSKCMLSPEVQVHLYKVYVCPIARSGLSALSITDAQLKPLVSFHKKSLRGFLKLSERSPIPALYFLTGELPIIAKVHMDVFSLFYNIWINPQTEIFKLVQYLLKYSNEKSHTWCRYIRKLACM